MRNFLPTKASKKRCFIFVGVLLFIYGLENSPIANYINGQVFNYIIKPIVWLCIIIIVLKLPKMRYKSLLKNRSLLNFWAFNLGIIFIIINIVFGIIIEFGRSPYNNSPKGILINIIFFGTALVGRELIRTHMVHNMTRKVNFLIFLLIALFYSLVSIPFKQFLDIKNLESCVQFCAEYFIPEISKNIFLTYYVFIGGALPSIIYQGIVEAFYKISPILPNLNWLMKAFIGIAPIFFLGILQNINVMKRKTKKEPTKTKKDTLSFIVTSVLSILMIWFVLGVFTVYPSVIVSGSMEPMIEVGDVILIKKVENIEDIKLEDVIQYEKDGILISHRIIEIKSSEEGISYVTKGDNNSIKDSQLVMPEQIKGKIIKVVPKIGWPTLLIKKRDYNVEKEVVF